MSKILRDPQRGNNIYPAEIERVLQQHPSVAMVAVGGVQDPVKGERAKAYIVPKEGAKPSQEEILECCRQHLATYKVPRLVKFVATLPQTSKGKIMRRELRKRDV